MRESLLKLSLNKFLRSKRDGSLLKLIQKLELNRDLKLLMLNIE
jgi:hypothetical protein